MCRLFVAFALALAAVSIVPAAGAAVVTATITAPAHAQPGGAIHVEIDVTNPTASDVSVSFPLSTSPLTPIEPLSEGCSAPGVNVVCSGIVAAGGTGIFSFDVGPVAEGTLITATLISDGTGVPVAVFAQTVVEPAVPDHLVFETQPSDTTAGSAIAPAVQVGVVDSDGAVVTDFTGDVTVALGSNPGGSTLAGTAVQTVVNGVATFSDLSLNKVGHGYTLDASTGGGITGATSSGFDVGPGAPAELVFTTQPSNVAIGTAIAPAVTVEVRDGFGNTATNAPSAVTMALGANPGGASLGGTTTVNAVGGIATFVDLSLDSAGAGYTLVATSPGTTSDTSTPFDVTIPVCSSFIDSLYRDALGRSPSGTERAAAANALGGGLGRTDLAGQLLGSPEYRADLVTSYYESFLGREPSGPELASWTNLLAGGSTDEQVLAALLGSAEFYADAGAVKQRFVRALYQDLLGREATGPELGHGIALISQGQPRAELVGAILAGEEYRALLIGRIYGHYLHRDPTSAELVSALAAEGTDEHLAAMLAGSDEYFGLAGCS